MRIMIKGGVWKNSEDEILKAAVMKYGKNQWARISSLMVRKSAKQCKARWYEWLDPSIQKTEWTRDEEEKLLHLAKIMPTQWRTIAPIVGRTASQCLEHYEKLLDQAQKVEDAEDGGASAAGPSGEIQVAAFNDPRKLRPGEIDPTPETKPARPDPVDMDEDEKEMLSEARARLANTRGKKAKRKAREKQLDEAKRLAHLQKRRELLAAGIRVRTFRKSRKDMDYSTEIPFEKKPAPGFYDVTDEDAQARKERMSSAQVGKLLEKYEERRRDDTEAQERKRDEKRRKIFEEKDLPAALAADKKEDEIPIRRSKLVLPAPQVSDSELEAVSKAVVAGKMDASSGSAVTRQLLTDYTPTPAQTPVVRTGANVESWEEVKKRELANLKAYNASSSALTGGENTPLAESDFSGVTPKRKVASTPNPLASPAPSTIGASPAPSLSAVTPRTATNRDGLRINVGDTEGSEKARLELLNRDLKRGLEALPEPRNDYKIVVDEAALPPPEEEKDEDVDMIEDAIDIELNARRKAAAEVNELRKGYLSRAAKHGLQVPAVSQADIVLEAASKGTNEEVLVAKELANLIRRDFAVRSALDASNDDAERIQRAYASLAEFQADNEEDLSSADKLVQLELEDLKYTQPSDATIGSVMDSVCRSMVLASKNG